MKKNLMMMVAAAMTFAACSTDDTPSTPGGAISPNATTAYAKVSISMPKGSQTRAVNPDPGTKEEATVSTVFLAFYDDAGVFVGEGNLVSEFNLSSNEENISDTYSGNICEVKLLGEGLPTQVVAFINAKCTKNLSDLLENGKVTFSADELYSNGDDGIPTDFVMTNSGYYDKDGNYVVAAQLAEGALFEAADADDAKTKSAPATEIYVERLAAKITVTADNLENEPDYTIYDIQGKEVTLEFTATNWGATGIVDKENVVKFWESGNKEDDNNSADEYRSYWADGVYYKEAFTYYYDDGKVANTNPLTYITYGDVDSDKPENLTEVGKKNVIYVPEHTTELQIAESAKNLIANTYALIVGEYEVKSTNQDATDWYKTGDEDDTDFYLLLARLDDNDKKVYTIYSKSQLIAYLLNYNGIKMVGTTNSEINKTTDVTSVDFDTTFDFTKYLTLKADTESGKYMLEVSDETETLYYMDGEEAKEVAEVDLSKPTNSRHYHYTNGHAYFNAPILHEGTFGGDDAIYGVVRNHSYVLNLTSVNSLGAPIDTDMHPNDDEPIIPNPDELTDHWINATINVLSWNVKESDVKL